MAVLGTNTLNHTADLLIQRAGTTRITVTSAGITVGGTLNGFTIEGDSGNRFTNIPAIGSDGVMEIGRYIDFHSTAGDTTDFTYRIDNTSNGNLSFSGNLSVAGNFSAVGNVIAYASDKRLKENFRHIKTPLEKIQKLNGYIFDWKDIVKELGFAPSYEKNDIGLIAQEVQEVLPQAVFPAPFDQEWKGEGNGSKSGENYLTIQYERLVPLLVEAIKDQQEQINILKNEIGKLKE
jgi:trimeric autotransporter adhesin